MSKLSRLLKEIGEESFGYWNRLPALGNTETKENLLQIMRQISESDQNLGVYGIRSMPEEKPTFMGAVKPSKKWKEIDNEWLPTRFNAAGPSAVSLDAIPHPRYGGPNALDLAETYFGNKYLLRAEKSLPLEVWNIDKGEVVLDRPRVLAGFSPQKNGQWLRILGLAGGGLASGAMLGGGNAQATPLSPEMSAWAKGAEKAQALEEPVWNPADLLAAPIGAVGVPARAAAMALDAPVTLALNEVLEYIGNAGKNAADWWRK